MKETLAGKLLAMFAGMVPSGPSILRGARGTGQRYQARTQATRRQIDPDPSLSRQQRRYAERLAAKREWYSDAVRRAYRVPLPA